MGDEEKDGVQTKHEDKFRKKKNAGLRQLNLTLFRRLKLTLPTPVSAIVPARVPISFRALPIFVRSLWSRMESIGPRNFQTLATEENFAIFLKCFMVICEATVCYAQIACPQTSSFPLPSQELFTEKQLRILKALASKMPYPLVIFVESIGNFMADSQPVVPVLATTAPDPASGAVSFAPSHLIALINYLKDPVPATEVVATIAREIDELPGIKWIQGTVQYQSPAERDSVSAPPPVVVPSVSISAESVTFWTSPIPSLKEREIFKSIIESMDVKSNFNIQCDISTGDGSVVQAVRFPDSFDPEKLKTLYYTNTEVPVFKEQLAPALQLGYEYQIQMFSRFCGSYAECLKHGSASAEGARHAVIWNSNE